MYDQVTSRARRPVGVAAAPLYRLGVTEFLKRWARAPRVLKKALARVLTGEGGSLSDLALSLFELLPPGLLETSGLQEYLRQPFKSRHQPDTVAGLARELYVVAVDLDRGESVAFGEEGHRDVPVSRAVQASAALPGLHRPVRLGNRHHVDPAGNRTPPP